jgi:hypothetical protein
MVLFIYLYLDFHNSIPRSVLTSFEVQDFGGSERLHVLLRGLLREVVALQCILSTATIAELLSKLAEMTDVLYAVTGRIVTRLLL